MAGGSVVLFALVDDHVHIAAHVSDVRGRAHLEWLVRYLLGQPAHHGIAIHPVLGSGSCFPNLVGARCVPALTLRVPTALPRYRLREAYGIVGLPQVPLEPATAEQIRAAGAPRLVHAAAFAAGAGPELGRDNLSIAVRRVTAALAAEADIHLDELAHAMGTTRDAARKIGLRPAAPGLLAATRLRIALESAAATAGAAAAATALRKPAPPAPETSVRSG